MFRCIQMSHVQQSFFILQLKFVWALRDYGCISFDCSPEKTNKVYNIESTYVKTKLYSTTTHATTPQRNWLFTRRLFICYNSNESNEIVKSRQNKMVCFKSICKTFGWCNQLTMLMIINLLYDIFIWSYGLSINWIAENLS